MFSYRTHEWIVVYFPNSWNVDFSQGDSARLLRCVQIVDDDENDDDAALTGQNIRYGPPWVIVF